LLFKKNYNTKNPQRKIEENYEVFSAIETVGTMLGFVLIQLLENQMEIPLKICYTLAEI
jgi:hypothetical protein